MKNDIVAQDFVSRYPSSEDLRKAASRRMPGFAFDYLDGGCNEDVNLARNRSDLQAVELMPRYLSAHSASSMETELFGHTYAAPFGVAPVGLQGMMWPNSVEILAKASLRHNVPFVLSTVTTGSIEKAAEWTEGRAWFQLYHPAEDRVRDDLLERAHQAECPVLVILADVPTFGHRPRDIRNGLAMPPSMSIRNILQMLSKPAWLYETALAGRPNFESLKPYMPENLDLKQLGHFMDQTFSGRLTEEKIKPIRDQWKGKLVVKGVVNEEDAETCQALGVDGIIVSNHGGRQLDAGQSTIVPLHHLAAKFGDQMTVMMDCGIRSGPDIARSLASGAKATFLGRTFMYGVGALGQRGGNHTISMLKKELLQVMEQLCCERVEDLPSRLIRR